jgi:hypothetical protein
MFGTVVETSITSLTQTPRDPLAGFKKLGSIKLLATRNFDILHFQRVGCP